MQPLQDFSSWQPEQERHFVVFEQRTLETSKRAWAVGIVAGIAFGCAVIGITIAFQPSESRSQAAARENPDLASENVAPAAAIAPVTAPATAPAPAALPASGAPIDPSSAQSAGDPASGSPTAGGSTPAPAAGAPVGGTTATPPPPAPGTTKAPPTDLVK